MTNIWGEALRPIIRLMVEQPEEFDLDLAYAKYFEQFELSDHNPCGHGPMSRKEFANSQKTMADPVMDSFLRSLYRV